MLLYDCIIGEAMYPNELTNRLLSAASLMDRNGFIETSVALSTLATALMIEVNPLGDGSTVENEQIRTPS